MILPAKLARTAFLTVALSALCVVGASAASVGAGTVDVDALRLREEASTSSTILATASKGDTVVVLEDAGNGWYKVDYKSVEGYMSAEYLTVSEKADVAIGYGLVKTGGGSRYRQRQHRCIFEGDRIRDLSNNTLRHQDHFSERTFLSSLSG